MKNSKNIIEEFYKNAKPTDVFERAHKEYLKWEEKQPDPNIEQAKLWALLGHQIPGSEIF
jgi:hypothetical protein